MPQGPTTNYQGGQSMVRNNPAGESWGAFVRTRLAALGMSQADLRRAMEAEGFPISRQATSQWFNGENAADPNTATVVATVLRASPAEAMAAAGYATAVDRMRLGGEPRGGPLPVAAQPVDPTIEDIMGMKHLGMKVRQALVSQYLADQEEAQQQFLAKQEESRRRARRLAEAMADSGGDGNAGNAA